MRMGSAMENLVVLRFSRPGWRGQRRSDTTRSIGSPASRLRAFRGRAERAGVGARACREAGSGEIVRVEVARGVMTVTLADLANRNALGADLVGRVREAIARANADEAVRALVLSNEGTTWCAGANLEEQSARNEEGASTRIDQFPFLLEEMMASPRRSLDASTGTRSAETAVSRRLVTSRSPGGREVRLLGSPAGRHAGDLRGLPAEDAARRGDGGLPPRQPLLRREGGRVRDRPVRPRATISVRPSKKCSPISDEAAQALGIAKRRWSTKRRVRRWRWAGRPSCPPSASPAKAREGMRAFLEKRDPSWIQDVRSRE